MKISILILVFLLLPAGFVYAEDINDCLSEAKNSPETAVCYAQEFERANGKLNSVYRNALAKIDGLVGLDEKQKHGVKALLITAQRYWVKFRDSDCDAVEDAYGSGTGASLGALQCKIQLTEHRIEELSRWDQY